MIFDQIRKSRLYRILQPPITSPAGLLTRAVLIAAAFAIVHALGLREATSAISGTTPGGQPLTQAAVYQAGLYLLAYFGFVVVAPILVIAAPIVWVINNLLFTRYSKSAGPHPRKSPAP